MDPLASRWEMTAEKARSCLSRHTPLTGNKQPRKRVLGHPHLQGVGRRSGAEGRRLDDTPAGDVLLKVPPFLRPIGLSWRLSGKEHACNAGDIEFNPWVGEIPWRRQRQPTPGFLPGESHGQRSLASSSPWGRRELDKTAYEHFCPAPVS